MATEIAEVGFSVPTQSLKEGDKALGALVPTAGRVEKSQDGLERQTKKTNSTFGKLTGGSVSLGGAFSKLVGGLKTLVGGFAGLVTGAIAGFAFANMISGAIELSTAIGELSTLLPVGSARLGEMQDAARAMADEFGTNAAFQLKAFYGAVSAGATTTAKAIDIVSTANKLAIGGITDVATGVDILTTSTNAYAASGLTAAQASDLLFVGMKAGKTTIGELASGLGNVVPIAAALGVGFDELVAGTAALTLQGLSTATAITSLRAILSGIAKPTSEASKLATELGLDFSTTALRSKGLAGFLQDVIEKTGGSADKLSVMFGSVEALNAALAFAGEGGNAFNKILDDTTRAAGETATAMSLVDAQLGDRWLDLLQVITNLSIDLGYALLSVIVPAAEAVVKVFKLASDNTDVLIIAFGVLAATQLPAIAAGFIRLAFALTSYNALAIYSATLSYALSAAMYAIPFIAVVAGLTLAYRWFTNTGEASIFAKESIESITTATVPLSVGLENVANGLAQTEEQLRSFSQTETLLAQARYADELAQSLTNAKEGVFQMALEAKNAGQQIDGRLVSAISQMVQGLDGSVAKSVELNRSLDNVVKFNPDLAPFIVELQKSVSTTTTLGTKLERTNALAALLEDRATDAQKAMLGIANTNIAGTIGAGADAASRLAGQLGISLELAARLSALGPQGLSDTSTRDENGLQYGGRGGDPRTMGGSALDINTAEATAFLANWKSSSLGGGSGGGAVKETVTELQKLAEGLTKLSEPFDQAKTAYSALDTALNNGVINNDTFVSSLERIQKAFLATGGTAEQWGKIVNGQTDSVASKMKTVGENALSSLGDKFIDVATGGSASFGDLASSIVKDLLKIAYEALVVKPILESLENIGGGGSGGGGFFGGILKGIGALFSAKGNAFDASGLTPFAKGGSFTNSIVDRATPFTFAQGGALGVMGEAGPEAIMPLTRGSNGSLGVQMYGGNQAQPKQTNVNNSVEITNVYRMDGAVSEERIVASVRAAGEATKEEVKQSMVGWINEYQTNGGL